jgi:lipoate-protein ligase A
MHGEYKTPGGKLVAVDFDVIAGALTNVRITGDFFLYPDEALDPIVRAIEGLPVSISRQEIAQAVVRSVQPGVALVGFSPEAIAIAIERGLTDVPAS